MQPGVLLSEKRAKKVSICEKTGCWIWGGKKAAGGYPVVMNNKKKVFLHRYVHDAVNGPSKPYPDNVIMHTCDNPACINPQHLVCGTINDNIRDRNNKQRQAKGEKSGRAKVTLDQVREIRRRYIPHVVTLKSLADKYGITYDQVHRIARYKSWREQC